MTRSGAAGSGRLLGRGLLTLANVITVAAPVAADWNDSHIFNERWPGHARFHGVTALTMATVLSSVNLWSMWAGSGARSGPGDQAAARFFAAAVPVAYWAPFFLAPLVPGTAVDDPPHPVARLAGCRLTCWARRPPRRRRPLDGSSTAGPTGRDLGPGASPVLQGGASPPG